MDISSLRDFFVVLVHPKHPGNVGATARAMGNMGLYDLRIVEDRGFALEKTAEAEARACDSTDILANARTFATLGEALADSVFAAGTSARPRDHVTPQAPRQVIEDLAKRRSQGKIGLVFGREDDGLTVEELAHCQALIRIPTNPTRSSLNLSHAVQVVLYELMLVSAAPAASGLPRPASQQNRDALFTHAERSLKSIGAFPREMVPRKLRYLRQVLDRALPSDEEVFFLHGIFRQIEWVMTRWVKGDPVPAGFTGGLPERAPHEAPPEDSPKQAETTAPVTEPPAES
jgi:TrmH family RNA methyltransferase